MTEVTICEVCGGNGFLRVPHYEPPPMLADQWDIEQCDVCHSSGEAQSPIAVSEDRR